MGEAIVKKRETKGLKEYYVKWKGFPSSENTWEPEGNLESAVELVKKFEESQGEKKRGRPPKDEKTEADPQEQEDAVGYDTVPPCKLAKISGARKDPSSGAVQFLCEWEGKERKSLEYSSRVKCRGHEDAMKIIEFYEQRLKFA